MMARYTIADVERARGLGVIISPGSVRVAEPSAMSEALDFETRLRCDAQVEAHKLQQQLCYWQITAGLLLGAAFVLGAMVLVRPQ